MKPLVASRRPVFARPALRAGVASARALEVR
jgi:hypothetical protein